MWSTKHQGCAAAAWEEPTAPSLHDYEIKSLISVFRWSVFTPLLEVCDAEGASAVRIQGSCCPCRCFSNQSFKVFIQGEKVFLRAQTCLRCNYAQIVSDIGEEVGRVWKKWPGFNEEQNMDHEFFGLDGEFMVAHIFRTFSPRYV